MAHRADPETPPGARRDKERVRGTDDAMSSVDRRVLGAARPQAIALGRRPRGTAVSLLLCFYAISWCASAVGMVAVQMDRAEKVETKVDRLKEDFDRTVPGLVVEIERQRKHDEDQDKQIAQIAADVRVIYTVRDSVWVLGMMFFALISGLGVPLYQHWRDRRAPRTAKGAAR